MQKISMVDLRGQYLRIKPEIDEAIQSVLLSTDFIKGNAVKQFEQAFSDFHEGVSAISCANGTDALQIALMGLGFQPGDEVILPAFTYVAPAEVIALLGLKPVFVDVDEKSFAIDTDAMEKKITAKTVAVIPVHLFGQCAPMEPLLELAGKYELAVIEDFAQAVGSIYTNPAGISRKAGTMGTVGCTSFFPSKNLGCYGDGGAVIASDTALAEKMRMIANHGQRVKYHHDIIGINSRLDTLQAAILNVKLSHLQEYEQKRRTVADYYDKHLAGVSFLELPYRSPYSTHVFHQYTLRVKGTSRDAFKTYLQSRSIPSMVYYPLPIHFQKAYSDPHVPAGSLPVSEGLSRNVLSLPIHTEMSEEQLSYICETIRTYPG